MATAQVLKTLMKGKLIAMQLWSSLLSAHSLLPSSVGFIYKRLCLDNKLQILDSLGTTHRQKEEQGGEMKNWKRGGENV